MNVGGSVRHQTGLRAVIAYTYDMSEPSDFYNSPPPRN